MGVGGRGFRNISAVWACEVSKAKEDWRRQLTHRTPHTHATMRGKRAKKYRKLMHQYEVNFNFRYVTRSPRTPPSLSYLPQYPNKKLPAAKDLKANTTESEPYQVLLDSEFLQDTHRTKIDILPRLQGVLGGEVKPMVSQCSMRHLYTATPKSEDLITQAKTYERRRCGHHELPEPLSNLECLSSCVDPKGNLTNKHRYVVATQDPKIRAHFRKIPGVPLVYVNKSVMILEPMASATEELRERTEKAKFREGLKGRRGGPGAVANAGEKRKREFEEEGEKEEQGAAAQAAGEERPIKKHKHKGPKGPNPLSVKKSRKAKPGQNAEPAKVKAPKTPKPKEREQHEQATESVAAAPDTEGGEGTKRKRKRKHKPKGDGGAPTEAGGDAGGEGEMDVS